MNDQLKLDKENIEKFRNEYQNSMDSLNYLEDVEYQPLEVSELWVDKYRPKTLSEYLTDNIDLKEAETWLKNYQKKKKKTQTILLLTGSPGIGKTTLAHLLFEKYNYDYREFNASESRTSKELKEYLEPFKQGSILSFFENSNIRGKALIMDEVDGIESNKGSGNDGLSTFLKITGADKENQFKYPIICIANDRLSNKVIKIKKYSKLIEFKPPSQKTLLKFINKIAKGEGLNINDDFINKVIKDSDPDFRQIANKLYMVSRMSKNNNITLDLYEKICEQIKNDKRYETNELFDEIFKNDNSYAERLRYLEKDLGSIVSKYTSNLPDNINKLKISKKEKISLLARTSTQISESEIFNYYYWKNRSKGLGAYYGTQSLLITKKIIDNVDKKKDKHVWTFTNSRIFYLNVHLMDRIWRIAIALDIYSSHYLPLTIELVWNILKSSKFQENKETYKKIMDKLFQVGIEWKDFEHLYKSFSLGNTSLKDNENSFKKMKPLIKMLNKEFDQNNIKMIKDKLESIPSQLDKFLSIES